MWSGGGIVGANKHGWEGNQEIRAGPSDQTKGNIQTLSVGSGTVVPEMCSVVGLDLICDIWGDGVKIGPVQSNKHVQPCDLSIQKG